MQSYLVRFLEHEVKEKNSDAIDRICYYLMEDVVPKAGNNFGELVEIARICKPMYSYAWYYKPFVDRLKTKIIEQRGEEEGQSLIKKFS